MNNKRIEICNIEQINIDNINITQPENIASRFNNYFVNVGKQLAHTTVKRDTTIIVDRSTLR